MTRDITFRLKVLGLAEIKLEGITGGSDEINLSRDVEIIGGNYKLPILRKPSTVQTVMEDLLSEIKIKGYGNKKYSFSIEIGEYDDR